MSNLIGEKIRKRLGPSIVARGDGLIDCWRDLILWVVNLKSLS